MRCFLNTTHQMSSDLNFARAGSYVCDSRGAAARRYFSSNCCISFALGRSRFKVLPISFRNCMCHGYLRFVCAIRDVFAFYFDRRADDTAAFLRQLSPASITRMQRTTGNIERDISRGSATWTRSTPSRKTAIARKYGCLSEVASLAGFNHLDVEDLE